MVAVEDRKVLGLAREEQRIRERPLRNRVRERDHLLGGGAALLPRAEHRRGAQHPRAPPQALPRLMAPAGQPRDGLGVFPRRARQVERTIRVDGPRRGLSVVEPRLAARARPHRAVDGAPPPQPHARQMRHRRVPRCVEDGPRAHAVGDAVREILEPDDPCALHEQRPEDGAVFDRALFGAPLVCVELRGDPAPEAHGAERGEAAHARQPLDANHLQPVLRRRAERHGPGRAQADHGDVVVAFEHGRGRQPLHGPPPLGDQAAVHLLPSSKAVMRSGNCPDGVQTYPSSPFRRWTRFSP